MNPTRVAALIVCVVLLGGCGSSTPPVVSIAPGPSATASPSVPPSPTHPPSEIPEVTIDDLLKRMTTDEKIGQLFMVSFYGDVADETNSAQVGSNRTLIGADNIAAAVAKLHLGGVIYFTWAGNLDSAKQIATLSNDVQDVAAAQAEPIPLLISTDQEGGSIVRLPPPATQFAGNMALGATRSPDLARSTGKAMGEELLAVGINDVLAPVGDVNVNPANPIIGLRSFGADASSVAAMTAAMVRGFQDDAGIGATVKHFPGHGDTDIDSHSQLPVITHSAEQWTTVDNPPFAAAVDAGVDSVMVGHLAFPALDPSGTPASLSRPIIRQLRSGLLFNGVVITDGLDMGALRDTYPDDTIPVMAIEAGDDILLMPPSLPVAYQAIQGAVRSGEISAARLDASVRRILALKQKLGLFGAPPVAVSAAEEGLGTTDHRAVEKGAAEASVTLLANDGHRLPIPAESPGPYLVVGPTNDPVSSLASVLRGRGVRVGTFVTGESPPSSTAAAVAARATGYGIVVDLTLDADTDTGQQKVVAALARTGKRLITVAIGRPYDQAYYGAAANICLYSSSDASLRALVAVLFGEIAPAGRLPVPITDPSVPDNVLYPLGYGLGY